MDAEVEGRGRTCVDPVREAERIAVALYEGLERLSVPDQKAALVKSILTVSSLGREVADHGASASGRARLRHIQRDLTKTLQGIVGRPILVPPIQGFEAEPLDTISAEEMEDYVDGRETRLVGRHYVAEAGGPRPGDLTKAVMIDCRLENLDFSEARLGDQTVLLRTRFVKCSFNGVNAPGLRGSGLMFQDCSFDGAVFAKSTFGQSVFQRNRGSAVSSQRVNFEGATFSYCRLAGLELPKLIIRNATFETCILDGTSMLDGRASNAVFCETSLIDCDLRGLNLRNAVFRNCDLRDARFEPGPNDALERANLQTAFNLARAQWTREQAERAMWPFNVSKDPLAAMGEELEREHEALSSVEEHQHD